MEHFGNDALDCPLAPVNAMETALQGVCPSLQLPLGSSLWSPRAVRGRGGEALLLQKPSGACRQTQNLSTDSTHNAGDWTHSLVLSGDSFPGELSGFFLLLLLFILLFFSFHCPWLWLLKLKGKNKYDIFLFLTYFTLYHRLLSTNDPISFLFMAE